MMHLPAILDSDCLYFQNNLTESDTLLRFIEECDLDESTHGYISPWTTFNEFTVYKTFNKNSTSSADDGLTPFNPRNKDVKPYIPPTEVDPDSYNPFGSVLDAPIG
jgi:hypothetical protein